MEYIQAVLFTFKYILGQNSNTDILYLFSALVLLFYAWRRHDKFAFILKTSVPFAIVCIGMALLYPQIDVLRLFIFFAKMVLNVTFMLFVAYNSRKWKLTKFVKTVVLILAVETGLAFLLPNSSLWVTENLIGGTESVVRLKLFFLNAGALSYACGFVLILLVYQLITEEVVWHQVIGVVVVITDIYLSYGLGGLTSALMAVVFMLCLTYVYKFKDLQVKNKRKFIVISVLSFVSIATMIITNVVYVNRAKNIIEGTDYILVQKLLNPMSKIGNVLLQTKWLGVGFGNANTDYALKVLDVSNAYPNSFLRIIAEGGIIGIALVLFVVVGLMYISFKNGGMIDKSLCVYILVYQFVGGYFTDPTNFLIYGLIIGNCIKRQIKATGTTKFKLFMPVVKETLFVGEIGVSEIIGTTKKTLVK